MEKLQSGPDPENPEEAFVDGANAYQVQSFPATFPTWGTQGESNVWNLGGVIFLVVYILFVGWIARMRDPRWKVTISRAPTRMGGQWRVVDVTFVGNSDAADNLVKTIIESWDVSKYERSRAMTSSEITAMRKSSDNR